MRSALKDSFCNDVAKKRTTTVRGYLPEGGIFSSPANAHLLTTRSGCATKNDINNSSPRATITVNLGGVVYSFSKYGLVLLQVKS